MKLQFLLFMDRLKAILLLLLNEQVGKMCGNDFYKPVCTWVDFHGHVYQQFTFIMIIYYLTLELKSAYLLTAQFFARNKTGCSKFTI